jgi:uncharacterized protein (DUF697 family)
MPLKIKCMEKTMRTKYLPLILCAATLVLSACSQPTTAVQTAEPSAPTAVPLPQATLTAALQPVTEEAVLNGTYTIQDGKQTVQLANGKYESGNGSDYVVATVDPPVTFGDLNGDGVTDAVAVLAENYGGSGTFLTLVPVLAAPEGASPQKGISLGDRVQVQSVSISGGTVSVSLLAQGPNDPMCCPSQAQTRTYEYLQGTGMVLMSVTSQTANGLTRTIIINTPAAGSDVTSPMPLSGSVTIAPFENNLVVKLYDASGTQISASPLPVTAAEMGGPGTFSTSVDLAAASVPAGMVRVEVVDTSPADGSILALAAVYVNFK